MALLNLTVHDVCPSWNYTIQPRSDVVSTLATPALNWEVIV